MMAALISYLYGSLVPTIIAQQRTNNITTQNSSVQPSPPTYPMQYYSYPPTYQPASVTAQQTDVADVATVNERVSRAAPLLDNAVTEQEPNMVTNAPPKHLETLPLDLIKHVVYSDNNKKSDNHHHHHHHHDHNKKAEQKNESRIVVNETTTVEKPVTVELPIVCPKCGSKMKLFLRLTSADTKHNQEYCSCDEENKPKYFCECARVNNAIMPQICSICNKIKRFTDFDATRQLSVYNWKPQTTPATPTVVFVKKTTPSFRRSVFAAPTTQSNNNYDNTYLWNSPAVQAQQPSSVVGEYVAAPSVSVEPNTITKRYAVFPSNEFAGYEQQQPSQDLSSIVNAIYEAAEHEPTCYCWRCRFIRRY